MRVWLVHAGLAAWLTGAALAVAPMAAAQGGLSAGAAQETGHAYFDLMNRAADAIRVQDWSAALVAAKAAFGAAGSDGERLDAARLVASAHFRAGQFVRAEWWLRRALNNATEGAGAQAVRQDFARVRQANRLTARFSFSTAPNNNVNNGSSSATVTLFNLPFILSPDARALSGVEFSGSVDLRYRLAQSPNSATDVGLLLYGRSYVLSPDAAAAAPGVSGGDYGFSVVEVLLARTGTIAGLPGPTTVSLNAGQNWYGGDPYTRYGRATIGQIIPVTNATVLNLSAGLERQEALSSGGALVDITTLAATVNHALQNRDVVAVSARLQQARSADPGSESTAVQLGVSYGLARPVLGTQVSLSASVEKRDFEFSIYDVAGRQDVTLSAGATVLFVNKSYFGFAPEMTLEANRTSSNIDLFDRQTMALRFGLRSAF